MGRYKPQVLEKDIERKCKKIAEAHGARFVKANIPGYPGFPDRLLIARRITAYVELKRPGGTMSKLQAAWHKWLEERGHSVWVVDNVADFEELFAPYHVV